MVIVNRFFKRKNSEGEEFFVLEVMNELELIQAKDSSYYATSRKATLSTTLSEVMCQHSIGKQLPGVIEKVPAKPYKFTLPNSEVIELDYTYQYNPKGKTLEEEVFQQSLDFEVSP